MPIKNNEPNRVQALSVRDLVVGMKVLTPVRGSTGVMVLGVRTITNLVEDEDTENDSSTIYKVRRLVFGNKHTLLKPSTEVIILAEEEPDEV